MITFFFDCFSCWKSNPCSNKVDNEESMDAAIFSSFGDASMFMLIFISRMKEKMGL